MWAFDWKFVAVQIIMSTARKRLNVRVNGKRNVSEVEQAR